MPVNTQDRPINAVREEVIDQLIMNYSHGKISLDAFERRLDQAIDSDDHQQLLTLVADLELAVDKQYVNKKKAQMGFGHSEHPAADNQPTEDLDYLVDIFGGSKRSGPWQLAKETRMLSIFSGSDIDLTEAKFTHSPVRIKLLSLFAGITIYVPDNVRIVTKAGAIFGGVDNEAPSVNDPAAPTIIIEGLVIFAGLDIKLRRTLKEKFMQFADGLKQFLGSNPLY